MITKERKLRQVDIHYKRANLPYKYIDYTINDFKIVGKNSTQKDMNKKAFEAFTVYFKHLETNLLDGRGIIICGPVGVGKTMLMTIIAKEIINIFNKHNKEIGEEANRFMYIQGSTLFQLAFGYNLNEREQSIRRGIKTISGLWIDDVSKFGETNKGNELVFLDDIVRYRDLNLLPTFYTSQVPIKELGNLLSVPMYDMIRGNCVVINFVGESNR